MNISRKGRLKASAKYLFLLPSLAAMSVSAQTDSTARQLQNVVVTGTRTVTDVRHLPFTVDVINRQQLTADYRPNVLPTLMEQVPGLMLTSRGMLGYGVSTNGSGGLNLRGVSGGSGQLLVLIDGHPQYQGIYGHPISDSYQTLMADRVEVLRGPASVIYGSNAMGGVVNIVTRGMRRDGVRTQLNLGAGSWGTFQSEVSNQVRSGRFSSTVAAQYQRSDNHRPNLGFEQYGGHLKLGYDISSHWDAYLDADLTHFNASNPGTVSAPRYGSRQWITRGMVSLGINNHYRNTNGGLSIYDNFGRHKINDGTLDPTSPSDRYFRSKDALVGVSWYQSAQLFQGNRVTVGVDYQHIYGRAWYTSIATGETLETPKLSGHSHRNEIAGYVDFRQDLASWLTLDAGVRVDHHSVSGTEWIPQGGIVVRPIQTGALKMMVSKGFRNPSMMELYLYRPANEDLRPERLVNYELSWHQDLLHNRLSYGINLYYIYGDNMIQTVPVDGNPRNVNTGKIENSGAEFELTWRVNSHLSLNTNHSVLHMAHHVIAAPEYKGYLGASWHQQKWTVSGGLQQIAGLYTNLNSGTENFTLLHATVSYQVLKQMAVWVKGDNLLAQKYEINAGFPMPRATFMGGVSFGF